MTVIAFAAPMTMRSVIAQCALEKPDDFRAALIAASDTHMRNSNETQDRCAASIALDMACDCQRMAHDLSMENFDANELAFSEVIQAFHHAARLQGLPRRLITELAARGA